MARLVYAITPFMLGAFLMALGGGLGARLFHDTGATWIRISALVIAAAGFACVCWGAKEFHSPSNWRRRPQWLREYEARSKHSGV